MLKRQILAFVAVGFALLSGFTFATGGFSALAQDEESCGTPAATGEPFMGMSDPDAPYDLRFIDEMVMHHRGAIMSAEMMIGDSERPELRDLAQRIQEEQQRQIDQMLAWRAAWYPDAATPAPGGDADAMDGGMMDGGGMMHGGMMDMMIGGMMDMMMDGEMTDRMVLRMMIPHHQLAIDMSKDALNNAQHKELKTLAQEIIDGQSAEIEEMEGYLQEWYGESSTRDAADEMLAMMQRMTGGC